MGYMHTKYDNKWRHPSCDCDSTGNTPLTVMHFLLECKKDELVKRREELKNSLIEIDDKYNDRLQYLMNPNATNDQKIDLLKTLLFPHLHYTTTQLKLFHNKLIKLYHLKMLLNYCRYRFPD